MEKSKVSGDTENTIGSTSSSSSVDNKNSDDSNNIGNVSVDYEDMIICEILSRLPIKSLMRFKCVSKTWLSLIEDDPHFADLHFGRSKARPALLMGIPRRKDPNNPNKLIDACYVTANLSRDGRKVEFHSVGKMKSFSCNVYCGPVNGFMCCFVRHKSDLCLYNISTKEETLIPPVISTLGSSLIETNDYELGYDPITKKHKVLCVCRIKKQPGQYPLGDQSQVCQVFTVGENAWRMIDEVPPCNFAASAFCVNGSIYYQHYKVLSGNWDNNDAVLVAFDVGSEKFRRIPIPKLILNNWPSGRHLKTGLLEVDGHIAICCRMTSHIVKIWVYKEDTDFDYKEKKTRSSKFGNREENWTEYTVTLPFVWDINLRWCFYTGMELHQILVQSYQRSSSDIDHGGTTLYSYDLKTKTFTEIEVNGSPFSVTDGCFIRLGSTFVESLFSVQKQRSSCEEPHTDIQQ